MTTKLAQERPELKLPAFLLGNAFIVAAIALGGHLAKSHAAGWQTDPVDQAYRGERSIEAPERCSGYDMALRDRPAIEPVEQPKPDLPNVPEIPAARVKPYERFIARAARAHRLDAALIKAVIAVESAYNPDAQSPAGASGLMQLMPTTAYQYDVFDLFDPAENIKAGALHLRYLMRRFNNDVALALAAYNAGIGPVLKHGYVIPPYRETRAYVPKVLAYYARFQRKKI